MEQPRTLTIKQAAELCGVTVTALRRRCDRGALRYAVVDGVRRIPVSELERAGLMPGAEVRALGQRVEHLERDLAETRQLTVRAESALAAERDVARRLEAAVAERQARVDERRPALAARLGDRRGGRSPRPARGGRGGSCAGADARTRTRRSPVRLRTWSRWSARQRLAAVVLGVVVAAVVLVLIFIKWAPEWLATEGLKGKDRAEEVGRARTAVLAALAGVIAIVGAVFTSLSYRLNREGQITERFTRAIDHLGRPELDVRLGGIYALERIARDSADDHPQVVEVLTAYVREHAPRRPEPEARTSPPTPGRTRKPRALAVRALQHPLAMQTASGRPQTCKPQ